MLKTSKCNQSKFITLLWSLPYAVFLLFFPFITVAQAHIHGMGEVLIVEEDKRWQIEIIIPAIDILGFESKASSTEQISKLKSILNILRSSDDILKLPNFCRVISNNNNLESFMSQRNVDKKTHSHSLVHDSHSQHSNVSIKIIAECEEQIDRIVIELFKIAQTIESLSTQYIIDGKQGFVELKPTEPILAF